MKNWTKVGNCSNAMTSFVSKGDMGLFDAAHYIIARQEGFKLGIFDGQLYGQEQKSGQNFESNML